MIAGSFLSYPLYCLLCLMPIAAPSGDGRISVCYRLVVLSDPHLPVREHAVKSSAKQQKIIEAKNKVIEDINAGKTSVKLLFSAI